MTNVGVRTEPRASVGAALAPAPPAGPSPAEARELAAAFRALGDPTRLQIVSLLLGAGGQGLCVCDIVSNFPLGQPTISHHLKILKDTGLLCARKKGLWVYYSVNAERLSRLGIALPVFSDSLGRSRCEDDGCDSLTDTKEVL